MKKLIFILLLTFLSQMSYADDTSGGDNSGNDDKGEKGHPHKSPKVTPLMNYDQGVLSITTPYILYDAEIIIRDGEGNVLYDIICTVSNNSVVFLPEYVSSRMQSIELIYSDNHRIVYV